MSLPPADILYGAAYQVLFEKIMPDRCVNQEVWQELQKHVPALKEWIATQSGEVSIAYTRALTDLFKRAADTLENNDRATEMREARKTLPTPP